MITCTTQVSASEYYLHDLPSSYNLVLKEVLGRGRFFKTILCKVLVKVYFKCGERNDLKEYQHCLTEIEDTFLALDHPHVWPFQLLLAVEQCHENGICYGDLKCENVLVTSWNWLYIADFASFKHTHIPYDDPSDFSFFFDTIGRRLCHLAPEVGSKLSFC